MNNLLSNSQNTIDISETKIGGLTKK